jgi:hypothetical protein
VRFDTVRVMFGSCCALISPTGSLGGSSCGQAENRHGTGKKG